MKKVDLKINQGKYSLSIQDDKQEKNVKAVVLGTQDNKIKIQIDGIEGHDQAEILQALRQAIHQYIEEAKAKPFVEQTFSDAYYEHESETMEMGYCALRVEKDALVVIFQDDDEESELALPYLDMNDVYVQRRCDLNPFYSEGERQYSFGYELWMVISIEEDLYAFTLEDLQPFLYAFAGAYFLAHIE